MGNITTNTIGYNLIPIPDCYITIGSVKFDRFYHIPKVSEKKSAKFETINILGRSEPIYSYGGGDARTLTIVYTLHNLTNDMLEYNMNFFRYARASVYPQYDLGYAPPPIGKFKFGEIYSSSGGGALDILIKDSSYSIDEKTIWFDGGTSLSVGADNTQNTTTKMYPQKFTITLNVNVIYSQSNLPGFKDILGGI